MRVRNWLCTNYDNRIIKLKIIQSINVDWIFIYKTFFSFIVNDVGTRTTPPLTCFILYLGYALASDVKL